MDSEFARFWWGQREEERRTHWKRWEEPTKARAIGGMGFKNLEVLNLALLCKLVWMILINPQELWFKVLTGLYFRDKDFLQATK